jgi:hypothetical protein
METRFKEEDREVAGRQTQGNTSDRRAGGRECEIDKWLTPLTKKK